MTTTEVPSETPPSPDSDQWQLSGWDLGRLLPDASPETLAAELDQLEEAVVRFESCRSELSSDRPKAARLLEMVRDYESLLSRAFRLSAYGSLWFAADTQDEEALTYRNRIEQVLTGVENRVLFFRLWWQELEDATASELIDAMGSGSHEELDDYRFYLADLRRFRPHRLSEDSEKVVNLKDADGIRGVLTLYSMITNAFEFHVELETEGKAETVGPLTRDGLMSYAYSDRPEHRAAAYRELYRVYAEHAKVLAQMYVHRVRDWHNENVELRGYESPIAVRNLANDIPDEAVETLLEVVREHSALFQRYFRLKASWLGVEKLRRYDIYAPLAASRQTVGYSEAVDRVLETFGRFDAGLGAQARRVFVERHIDSEPRAGKKGGAFCATVLPEMTPWVLVNWNGRLRDVATLAHEMGHAVHSMLAQDHSLLTQQPSLPLAETASVFAEILMTDRLLDEQTDPLAKRELLASAVDDMYATVLRQTYFVLFEKAAHAAILEGKGPEELHEMYLQNLREQFGDAVELSQEFRLEWLSIPHIYSTPFYCYAYSFGQLLVLALYRRFQEEGEAFKPGYLRLLAQGGSKRPEEVLAEVGVDVRDRDFWSGGFAVVAEMIEQLEEL